MAQKVILFEAGTHGNFLKRFLNVCACEQEDHNFYNQFYGAHDLLGEDLSLKYQCTHPRPDKSDIEENFWLYINVNSADMYILNWHVYYAAGESGIDVLDNSPEFSKNFIKRFYDKGFKLDIENNEWPTTRKTTLNRFTADDNGVREFFKYSIHAKHFLTENNYTLTEYNIENLFEFSWFYAGEDTFVKQIKQLLGNEYIQDCSQYNSFYEKKQGILRSQQRVQEAFECLLNGRSCDISDFCIYEQAGLDCLIEKHYDINLQTYYEAYPSNISDYQIREDK